MLSGMEEINKSDRFQKGNKSILALSIFRWIEILLEIYKNIIASLLELLWFLGGLHLKKTDIILNTFQENRADNFLVTEEQ